MTTEAMAFFVEHTSGVVCIAMEGEALDRLALPLMVPSRENEEALYTAFTVTVDARNGISTGISAADRALTVRLLADPGSCAQDFRRPGHLFPLRYRPGGVLARPGHTEAAVDLSRLAGCQPAGGAVLLCQQPAACLAFKCSHSSPRRRAVRGGEPRRRKHGADTAAAGLCEQTWAALRNHCRVGEISSAARCRADIKRHWSRNVQWSCVWGAAARRCGGSLVR